MAPFRVIPVPGSVLPGALAYSSVAAALGLPKADLKTYELDRDALARFDRPVYFALGGLSDPDLSGTIATRLSRVSPGFELEVFEERHHCDPPHRVESEPLADSLKALWRRGDR